MRWINIFHAYQPPDWDPTIIKRVVRECYQPTVLFLYEHPEVKLTLNLAGSLTEQLVRLGFRPLLQQLGRLIDCGQVELMTMPKYHPLIPFLTAEELRQQVEMNDEVNVRALGVGSGRRGFFPPELAIDATTGSAAEQLGCRWILLDEIASGAFDQVIPERGYNWEGTNLRIVYRNRRVSDYLAFEVQARQHDGLAAVLQHLGVASQTVVTAMDLENLGHHRPGADQAWRWLVTKPGVEMLTVSEYLTTLSQRTAVAPLPCSWSTDDHDLEHGVPYPLWDNPANPVHRALRALFRGAQEALLVGHDRPGYTKARGLLDRAQASDVFWWASMRPMWDASIVLREAAELYRSVDPLKVTPHPLQHQWNEVQRVVRTWNDNGRAAATRTQYLDLHNAKRFFAGHHLT